MLLPIGKFARASGRGGLRIVAEVALDAVAGGVPIDEVTPVWNAIAPASNLAKKLGDRLSLASPAPGRTDQ